MGRSGSWIPARLRRMASDTFGNGLVLTHYPLVQDLVHVQQFLPFAFHELGYRDTGPAGHDPGDLLIGDTVMQEVRFPFGLFGEFLLLFQFLLELGQTDHT